MIGSEIYKALNSFRPIGLSEMDEVMLMNRVELKYVFSASRLAGLLDLLTNGYRVLEIDYVRNFPYHTTYLDTPDLLFYNQQVRGKLNRHKIRYRRYESTGLSFLEIKKKTNQNRTIKWRIENSLTGKSPDEDASAFINQYLPDSMLELSPVLINGFSRITLVSIECLERITFDYNINFTNPKGRFSGLPFLAIAEVKRECHCSNTQVGKVLKHIGIQPNRFSKYSIGSAIVCDVPKKNTLKPSFLLLNKIENEYSKFS